MPTVRFCGVNRRTADQEVRAMPKFLIHGQAQGHFHVTLEGLQ